MSFSITLSHAVFALNEKARRNLCALFPPELAADIVDKGVVVSGGGSLIKGLDILFKESTGLPITLAVDPLSAVAIGAGKVLAEPKLLRKVTI